MDETELEIEIACWIQDHREADASIIDLGLPSKRGTFTLMLGNLAWSIEVPARYRATIHGASCKWKRLQKSLESGSDTTMAGSKSADTFKVSVVKNYWKNNVTSDRGVELQPLDMSGFWYGGLDSAVGQENNLNIIIDSQQLDQCNIGQSSARAKVQTNESTRRIDPAVREEKALTDVLNLMYSLAMLYQEYQSSSADIRDDNLVSESDMTKPWNVIAKHAGYAHEACKRMAAALSSPPVTKSEEDIRKGLEELALMPHYNSPSSSASSSSSDSYVSHFRQLKVDFSADNAHDEACKRMTAALSSPRPPVANSEEDTRKGWEEVVLTSRRNSPASSPSSASSDSYVSHFRQLKVDCPDFAGVAAASDCSDSERYYGDDSESSESGWVMVSAEESDAEKTMETKKTRRAKRKAQIKSMQSRIEPSTKRAGTSSQSVGSRKEKYQKLSDEWTGLKWCTIEFNSVSCSVECLFQLSEFMNPAAARALGLNPEHPLRVEIVPNKEQVENFSWYGDVETFASQRSDYHNHVPEEEICGLLFVIPSIVQAYFHEKVPKFRENFTKASEDNLFIGVIEAIAKRLSSISARESCCICGRWVSLSSRRQSWPCMDNLCVARYETWQGVTSSEIWSRTTKKKSRLQQVEQKLRKHFTFFYQDELKFALDVYGVNTVDMSYDQMISVLTGIEAWNEHDTNPEIEQTGREPQNQTERGVVDDMIGDDFRRESDWDYRGGDNASPWRRFVGNCCPGGGFR